MIIAIDGPAASGKGTLARRLAETLNLAYLDTGGLYRAVGLSLIRAGADPADEPAALAAAKGLDMVLLQDPDLRLEATGQAASQVARMASVRAALLDAQRHFAAAPPAGYLGTILDGRDIGTVVCPNADVKLFVTATVQERARRRTEELQKKGQTVSYDTVLADLQARDEQDCTRATAPLKPASDAILLETSNLDIEAAFQMALSFIQEKIGLETSRDDN